MIFWAKGASSAIFIIGNLSSLNSPQLINSVDGETLGLTGYSKLISPYNFWAFGLVKNSNNAIADSLFFENLATPPPDIFIWAPLSPLSWFGKINKRFFIHSLCCGSSENLSLPK